MNMCRVFNCLPGDLADEDWGELLLMMEMILEEQKEAAHERWLKGVAAGRR